MRIEMPAHSTREDIHSINGDIMTLLSDLDIKLGDDIVSPYKRSETHYAVYHVEEIREKRRPMGDWKCEPPNLYKIRFTKHMVKLEEGQQK